MADDDRVRTFDAVLGRLKAVAFKVDELDDSDRVSLLAAHEQDYMAARDAVRGAGLDLGDETVRRAMLVAADIYCEGMVALLMEGVPADLAIAVVVWNLRDVVGADDLEGLPR